MRSVTSGRDLGRLVGLASCTLLLLVGLGFPRPAAAEMAGSLDRAFGRNGLQLTDFHRRKDEATAVAVQRDGKIVVAGRIAKPGFTRIPALARYRRNGRLDRGFAGNGKASIHCDSSNSHDVALAIQPNDKILVAATCGANVGVARFRHDGRLDRSFGRRGIVRTAILPGIDHVSDLAVQPDGKVVAVGYAHGVASGDDYLIMARYDQDGTLDPGFADGGTLITRFGTPANALGYGVAIQDDGKLIAAGEVGNNWIVARFLPDGTLDGSFADGGVSYSAPKLIGQARGRYLPNGLFDPGFGDGGAVHTSFGRGRPADADSLALQDDGKIVVVGTTPSAAHGRALRFALARFLPDGQLDATFGGDGKVATGFHRGTWEYSASANSVALEQDGRIVAAGYMWFHKDQNFALARYLGR